MAWYDVDFACGHTGSIQLYGNDERRKNRIEYLEQFGICPTCYKKEQEAAREKKCAENNSMNDAGYLTVTFYLSEQYIDKPHSVQSVQIAAVKMQGSPKQISWAVDKKIELCKRIIEHNLISATDSMDELLKNAASFDPKLDTFQAIVDWTVDNLPLPVLKKALETESASKIIGTNLIAEYEKECWENYEKECRENAKK